MTQSSDPVEPSKMDRLRTCGAWALVDPQGNIHRVCLTGSETVPVATEGWGYLPCQIEPRTKVEQVAEWQHPTTNWRPAVGQESSSIIDDLKRNAELSERKNGAWWNDGGNIRTVDGNRFVIGEGDNEVGAYVQAATSLDHAAVLDLLTRSLNAVEKLEEIALASADSETVAAVLAYRATKRSKTI